MVLLRLGTVNMSDRSRDWIPEKRKKKISQVEGCQDVPEFVTSLIDDGTDGEYHIRNFSTRSHRVSV